MRNLGSSFRLQLAGKIVLTMTAMTLCNEVMAGAVHETNDWPQFRGPHRDGVSREIGLLKAWPESGPTELWRVPLGAGFSGTAIVKNQIYTMDSRGDREFVVALAADTGRELWRTPIGKIFKEAAGNGPRSTPTVEGGFLWGLGSFGDFAAFKAEDGQKIWAVNLQEKFGAKMPIYGFVTAPLIVDDLVLIEAGGPDGQTYAAFNKKTGDLAWASHDGQPAYSSPIEVKFNGVEQSVFLDQTGLVALSRDGEVSWTAPFGRKFPIKVAMPIFVPPDMIVVSASYDIGAMAVRMKPSPKATKKGAVLTEIAWENRLLRSHFNSPVYHGGLICGFDNAALKCIDVKTGQPRWTKRGGLGKGSLIYADGHLIVLSEQGKLLMIEADASTYKEKSAVQTLEGPTWIPPALAQGRLYLRGKSEMVCFDLRAQ